MAVRNVEGETTRGSPVIIGLGSEGAAMSTREEAFQLAQECVEWARKAKTDVERRQFLEMAAAWAQVANEREARQSAASDITRH
jgi:hypothetical protein